MRSLNPVNIRGIIFAIVIIGALLLSICGEAQAVVSGKIIQLTDNDYPDSEPQISGARVVWCGWAEGDSEIFYYDGRYVVQITDYILEDYCEDPQISGTNLVWSGWATSGAYVLDVFLNGSLLSDYDYQNDIKPQVSGSNVVWQGEDSDYDDEIYFYNGSSRSKLTDNSYNDKAPQISGINVVWYGYDGNDNEIFFYDGNSTTQVTDNNYSDIDPQISDSNLVWRGYDGNDYEIFFYDGANTVQVTDNSYEDRFPQISGSSVAWQGHDGNDYEIYLFTTTLFVDSTAVSGANNGTSWEDAYLYLQDALAEAQYGSKDIWVAEGIYRPDESGSEPNGSGERSSTFEFGNYALSVHGGFPASGGLWEERDPAKHETILSGDIGIEDDANDNSYHVVSGSASASMVSKVLDGFTVTGGNSADVGGGMYNNGSQLTVTNCRFMGNKAVDSGGGMYNNQSSPTVMNCTFIGNSAGDRGGGIGNEYNSDPIVAGCSFSGNSASNYGGGVDNESISCDPTLVNCILWGNTASAGPQIYDDATGSPTVSYCDVQGGWPGTGNIDADPLFVDASAGNLRLDSDSPCIDAGDNNSVPPGVTSDLDNHPRIIDGDCNDTEIVDIGAYEFGWVFVGDFYGGCDVDFKDFAVLANTWLLELGAPGYNPVCDISIPADEKIDASDLEVFMENWLEGD